MESCRISVSVRGISLILNFKPSSVRDCHQGKCSYCDRKGLVMDIPDFITIVKDKLEAKLRMLTTRCLSVLSAYRNWL